MVFKFAQPDDFAANTIMKIVSCTSSNFCLAILTSGKKPIFYLKVYPLALELSREQRRTC